MKFKVAKKLDLEPALAVVKGSLGSGDDLDSHLLFRVPAKGDGTKMEVLTHVQRMFSSCPFKAEVEQVDGDTVTKFTIKESRIRMALNAFPDDSVVTFETTDGKVVKVSVDDGDDDPTYQSLDPEDFRFWDKLLEKAEVKATLPASRLAGALNYSRQFASDEESRHPELCVCEVKDAVLASTDNNAAAFLKVAALDKSNLRVHYKDVGGILSFLGTCNGDVEILEYDRGMFLRRADGAVFGEGRFQANFPAFKVPDAEDQSWWVLPLKDLKNKLQILKSSAKDKDRVLTFARTEVDGPIWISMASSTGKVTKQKLVCTESGSKEGEKVFTGEFDMNLFSLEKVLRTAGDSETLRFGVNRRNKGGYFRFGSNPFKTDTDPGDEYLVLVRWTRVG